MGEVIIIDKWFSEPSACTHHRRKRIFRNGNIVYKAYKIYFGSQHLYEFIVCFDTLMKQMFRFLRVLCREYSVTRDEISGHPSTSSIHGCFHLCATPWTISFHQCVRHRLRFRQAIDYFVDNGYDVLGLCDVCHCTCHCNITLKEKLLVPDYGTPWSLPLLPEHKVQPNPQMQI